MGSPEVIEDRRAAIGAALDAQEESPEPVHAHLEPREPIEQTEPTTKVEPQEKPDFETKEVKSKASKEPTVPPAPGPEGQEPVFDVNKAPQSWRAPQKAQWDKLPVDIRQEVVRRERETTKVLGEASQARQFASQFGQVIAPFQARISSLGMDAVSMTHELLKADYLLSTAPKAQKAQYMAKLISDYGVDILELDSALAGKATPADPVQAQVSQLLEQQLAPFRQYIQSQQQREQQHEQQSTQVVNQTVEAMANDPKYTYFEDVRQDMADIVEMGAKRGVFLSLDDAYSRAIAMNPEISQQVATQRDAEARKTAANKANASAQRALGASISVGGAPGGVSGGSSGAIDRRSTIAAAFESIGGR